VGLHTQSAIGEETSDKIVALEWQRAREERKKGLRCSGARDRRRWGGREWMRRRERDDRSVTKRA